VANAGLPHLSHSNPLAGMKWGVYKGPYYNSIYPDYAQAQGRGAGFLNGQYQGDVNNPRVCRDRYDTLCVTLGIPPTTQVANPRWHLPGADASLAFRYVDAYLWAGRPWLGPTSSFDLQRALGLASSTPF
jgi:hypothetical protein